VPELATAGSKPALCKPSEELKGRRDPLGSTVASRLPKAGWLHFPLDNISRFVDCQHSLHERSRLLSIFLVGFPGESYAPSPPPHPWLSSSGLTEAAVCV